MRIAFVAVMVTLILVIVARPMHGQKRADQGALETIRMIDQQTGWAVTDPRDAGALIRTTDGGIHWRDVTPMRAPGNKIKVWRISVLSPLIAWVVPSDSIGANAEIFRTVDGGRTWGRAVIPAPGVSSISFINPREGWLMASLTAYAGKQEVEIYRSGDGGETWIKVASATRSNTSSGLPVGGSKTAITFLNPETGWVGGISAWSGGLNLYVTHDGGYTWRQQTVPLPRELTAYWRGFPQPPKFFTARDGLLPVFYDLLNDSGEEVGRIVVFYSTHDGGTRWTYTTPVRVSMSDLAYQAVADINHAWVMNGGALRATRDGGYRWTLMPKNSFFSGVKQLDFISPSTGWAVRGTAQQMSSLTFPYLLKTLDGGRTWSHVTYTIVR